MAEKKPSERDNVQTNDDYDPFDHREDIPHPTSSFETLIHLLKGALGTGILATPEAFMHAGIIPGLVCTTIICIIVTYSLHILVKAHRIVCKRRRVPVLSFRESMKGAVEDGPKCFHKFGKTSAILVDIFMVLHQLGIMCIYIVFVPQNIKRITEENVTSPWPLIYYQSVLLIPFVLILSIPNLKKLAPFSTFANILSLVTFGLIYYYLFQDMHDFSRLNLVTSFYKFSLYFGTALYAVEPVGVVIALVNNMKTPKQFGGVFGVLNVGMCTVTLVFVSMGFLGYWSYGEKTEASITLNLPPEIPSEVAIGFYAAAIFISFGLQGYVAIDILWNIYIVDHMQERRNRWVYQYLLRIFCVLFTFMFAALFPSLGPFISLIGALCLSALGIIIPAIMDLCVYYLEDIKGYWWIVTKDVLLILFGLIGLVAGCYTSINEIVKDYEVAHK